MKDQIALIASFLSLLVSSASLWESDRNRRISEHAEARTVQSEEDARRLTQATIRPWVTLSGATFVKTGDTVNSIRLTFTNLGNSPAMDVSVTPLVEWDSKVPVIELQELKEKAESMELGSIAQGESREMNVPGDYTVPLKEHDQFSYGVLIDYVDVHHRTRHDRVFGGYDWISGLFTHAKSTVEY